MLDSKTIKLRLRKQQKKTYTIVEKLLYFPVKSIPYVPHLFFKKDWLKYREKNTASKLLKTKTHVPLSNLKKFCPFAVRSLVQKLEFDNFNFFKTKQNAKT